jgi:hypothetical protein
VLSGYLNLSITVTSASVGKPPVLVFQKKNQTKRTCDEACLERKIRIKEWAVL